VLHCTLLASQWFWCLTGHRSVWHSPSGTREVVVVDHHFVSTIIIIAATIRKQCCVQANATPEHVPGITLQPQASPAHATPHSHLAVNVIITPAPESPRLDAPTNPCNPHAEQAQKVHWTATRNKFQGRHHGPTADTNMTLLSFSIDPRGSPGFFANRLLFNPKPPDKPPWQKQSNFTSEAAFKAFSKAMTSPRSFLKTATSKCDATTPFGHTHSTRTPQQWATQMLGLNFVTSSARFLLRAVASMTPAPSTTARSTPKFSSPPLGAKLAHFPPRHVLRADDPPMTPGR
jgi:hypothetical protein